MAIQIADFLNKVTVVDGAWGTELDKLGCPAGFCREQWNLSKPELVQKVPESYVQAGARIVLTNTFGGNQFALAKHGLEGQVEEINRAGAEISKNAARDKALVFGSIGPSGKMVMMGEVKPDELYKAFLVQAQALADGGADGLVIETMTELSEAQQAVRAAKETSLPVVACMTFDSGKEKTDTMMGVSSEEAAQKLIEAGADGVGCNCGIGIENYIKVAAKMRVVTDRPIWVKANAGLPEIEGGNIVYKMSPDEFVTKAAALIDAGANFIGGCCGTTPDFVAALSRKYAS